MSRLLEVRVRTGFAFAVLGLSIRAATASPLTVHFDYSRAAIGIDVTVKGKPLVMLLDTGGDPSLIELEDADALGLKVDRGSGGEASGVGAARHAEVYESEIDGLQIGGRSFGPVEALAGNLSATSAAYGRKLDGILGYSFLKGKVVLIDYLAKEVRFLDSEIDAAALTKRCAKRFDSGMQFLKGENWPLIADFRLGSATAPMTLDTSSNDSISLFQGALDLKGVRTALHGAHRSSSSGVRGSAPLTSYSFGAPVGFGPFELPPGQLVTLRSDKGSADTRLGNVGNKLFAAMTPMMLLDYRDRHMTFYGDCQQER
jgi:hypothetical protein